MRKFKFWAKKPKFRANRVFRLHEYDSEKDIIRLNPNLMKDSGFSRNELIAIKNRKTGAKTYAFAAGAGEDYKLYPGTIAINYDARLLLGVNVKEKFDLELSPASFFEAEEFYLKHQHSLSARRAHNYSVQGWVLGAFGFASSMIGLAQMIVG